MMMMMMMIMHVLLLLLVLVLSATAAVAAAKSVPSDASTSSSSQQQKMNETRTIPLVSLRRIQFCAGRDQSCGLSSTNGNNIQCCGSDQCVVGICKSSTCGGNTGTPCLKTSDCCSPLHCRQNQCQNVVATPRTAPSSGGSGLCKQMFQSCVRTSDCCNSLHCRQNICDRSQCGIQGQICQQSSDCCVNGLCNNGVCVFSVQENKLVQSF